MSVRITDGGSTGRSYHVGPIVARRGYTTTNGRCDDVAAEQGEVVARIRAGSPYSFSVWVRGPVAEVIDYLRTHGRADLAEEVATATLPEPTPMALLAHALGVPTSRVVAAADAAKLRVICGGES